jgi:hypothetical protein
MHRPEIEIPDQRGHVGGMLGYGVAVGGTGGPAGTAMIRQHDEIVRGKPFDLRAEAFAGGLLARLLAAGRRLLWFVLLRLHLTIRLSK